MHLEWQQTWGDIIETGARLLAICEERLPSLASQQQQRSGQVLQRVRQQLENDAANIRRQPHFWGTQLAQVAVRVAKRLPITDANRPIVGQLANYCALVFDYRRKSDKSEQGSYEGLFRDSLQLFLTSRLPDLVPDVIAPDLLDEVRAWLTQFYDKVPKDFSFVIHDIILDGYEARRRELDKPDTHGLMVRFVEDNKDLISMPVSEAREPTRTRWEDIYRNHIGEPPPPPGERAISTTLKARLKKAVQSNDPMLIRDIIAPAEPALVKTIKDALDVSFEFKEPRRTVQNYSHRPTADFERARRQIRSGNQQAVSSFYGASRNRVVREW